jgi:drug/metabolite transporter (DMT)-like permease
MVPVMSAIVSIITRQLKHIHASILMLWFGMGGLVVSLGGLIYTGQYNFENYTKSPVTIVGIMGIVVLGIAGNVLYTVAMKYVSPSKANVFRSFEVILNYVLQITIEHMSFHLISIAGIACLLLAVIATGFEKEAMKKWRAKFRFL